MKKAKRKQCPNCKELIPIVEWESHQQVHTDQVALNFNQEEQK